MKKSTKVLSLILVFMLVFSSIASAAATPGIYLGGSVGKYYSLTDYFNKSEQAIAEMATAGLTNVAYVHSDGKIAVASELFGAGSLGDAYREIVAGDLDESYVKADGTGTIEPGVPAEGELEVVEVSAITTKIDITDTTAQLEFAINGETEAADVAALTEAGYTVTYEATVAVTAAGVVDGSAVATPFEYRVVISHDDLEEDIVSELQEVVVENYAAVATEITKVELTANSVVVESGKIALDDTGVSFTAVEGTNKAETEDEDFQSAPYTIEYASSNPAVAVVSSAGVITPISAGNVTITITVGDVEEVVVLEVVEESRAASTATFDAESIRLINGATKTVKATVVDQYGDLVDSFTAAAVDVLNADEDSILTATPGATGTDGTVNIVFTADAANVGTGTMELKNGTTVIGTLPVEIGTGTEVAYRTIEIDSTSESDDYELDLYVATDDELIVNWNQYNSEDMIIAAESSNVYDVTSSDVAIATVVYDDEDAGDTGAITVTPVAEGTATITIKQGTITRASFDVTVIDTTPAAASIALAEDVTEIELSKATGEYVFTDIDDNFEVLDQFGETIALTDADVEFFTDDETVVDVTDTVGDGSGDPAIDVSAATVGDTATLIVKVNGKVVSVTVKVVA